MGLPLWAQTKSMVLYSRCLSNYLSKAKSLMYPSNCWQVRVLLLQSQNLRLPLAVDEVGRKVVMELSIWWLSIPGIF